jgi:hypothetical protein
MRRPTPWTSLAFAAGLCLLVPLGAVAQSEPVDDATPIPVSVPELEGLAWYRSVDVSGPQIEETRDAEEVADWSRLVEGAGATFDDLQYSYYKAFDPSVLPRIGELAVVRIAGAETEALRAAVVQDIVDQMVSLGNDVPLSRESVIDGKATVIVDLPAELGLEDAIVYASGDVAYVLLLDEELAAQALAQLP